MAIGYLLILFIVMSVISILGLLLMYLVKNERVKTALFYIMAVWGMVVAYLGASSLPSNFTTERILAWAFGFLSVIGLLLHLRSEAGSRRTAAYILVTASVVLGVVKLFLF